MTQLPQFLRCPEDRSPLQLADSILIARINEAVRRGTLTDRSGQRLTREIDGGLIRAPGDVIYPIINDIPVLLIGEAISLAQIPDSSVAWKD